MTIRLIRQELMSIAYVLFTIILDKDNFAGPLLSFGYDDKRDQCRGLPALNRFSSNPACVRGLDNFLRLPGLSHNPPVLTFLIGGKILSCASRWLHQGPRVLPVRVSCLHKSHVSLSYVQLYHNEAESFPRLPISVSAPDLGNHFSLSEWGRFRSAPIH